MLLEVKNIDYYYQDGSDLRYILKDTNATFENGKFYTIIGESGSGKTTFLSLLGSLDKPKKGSILIDGKDIFSNVNNYRKKRVGFVFQSYNLIPYLSAYENIELAIDIASNKTTKEKILKLLQGVGISEDKVNRPIVKLSGGEQQRVAIARSIANKPDIILGDEPTGNLDEETSNYIVQIFKMLAHELNKCVIIVTHNKEIAKISDVIYEVSSKEKKLIIKDGSTL